MAGMKVLIFCAHADDEVIAVGGTLRKMADAGAGIRLVMFSGGAEGYTRAEDRDSIVETRHGETRRVCDILGIKEYVNLGLTDWSLTVENSTYHAVIHHIREFRPDLVLTHSRADYNDHIVVHDVTTEGWFHAGIPCAMDEGEPWEHVPLYEFEVLQPIAHPSHVVDITDTYEAKVEAMKCYGSQHDLVGSVFQMIEGRSLERGQLIGVKYGEALSLSRYRPRMVRDVELLAETGSKSQEV